MSSAVWLFWAAIALLPFGRSAELPMAIAGIAGLVLLWRSPAAWRRPPARWAALIFLGYWLPQLLSAFDSVDAERSWREVGFDLRYLPMLVYFALELSQENRAERAANGLGWIVLLWGADALLQALTGFSLGGASSADRLSGIFGAEDLKLGPMLVALSPFLIAAAWHRRPWLGGLAVLLIGSAVILAGTRSAWIMLLLVIATLGYAHLGARRAGLALLAVFALGSLIGTAAYHGSESFAGRIDRSRAVFSGDRVGLDHALAYRLPIWENAWRMTAAHPINGVGVRAYRDAYPEYAEPGDRWLGFFEGKGAAHAHNIVLELLSETGLLGLLIWCTVIGWLWRLALRVRLSATDSRSAWSAALIAMLFPLNTHYAVYSSEWGGLLLVLAAGWMASWAGKTGEPRAVQTASAS